MKPDAHKFSRSLSLALAAGFYLLATGCSDSKVDFNRTVIHQPDSGPEIPSRTDESPAVDTSVPDGIEHPPYDTSFLNRIYIHPMRATRILPWQTWPVINHADPFTETSARLDAGSRLLESEVTGLADHGLNETPISPADYTMYTLRGDTQRRCLDRLSLTSGAALPSGSTRVNVRGLPQPFSGATEVVCFNRSTPMNSQVQIAVAENNLGEVSVYWAGSTAMKRLVHLPGTGTSGLRTIEMKLTARIGAGERFNTAAGEAISDQAGEMLSSFANLAAMGRCALERVHYLTLILLDGHVIEGRMWTDLRLMDVGVYESMASDNLHILLGHGNMRDRALTACRSQLEARSACLNPDSSSSISCDSDVMAALNLNFRDLINQGAPIKLRETVDIFDDIHLRVEARTPYVNGRPASTPTP